MSFEACFWFNHYLEMLLKQINSNSCASSSIYTPFFVDKKSKKLSIPNIIEIYYFNFQEYISEVCIENEEISLMVKIKRKLISFIFNLIILGVYIGIGNFLWLMLEKHAQQKIGPVVISLTANMFNMFIPILFTKITR